MQPDFVNSFFTEQPDWELFDVPQGHVQVD
jgi:hypothetical protein